MLLVSEVCVEEEGIRFSGMEMCLFLLEFPFDAKLLGPIIGDVSDVEFIIALLRG